MRRKRRALGVSTIALVCLLLAGAAYAADRTDPDFGGGWVVTPVPAELDGPVAPNVWDLAADGNGGFVGALADLTRNVRTFGIVRYRNDGTLDAGFGDGGFAALSQRESGQSQAQTQAVVVEPGGRIVAAGYRHGLASAAPVLAAYRPDGSLDPSFGKGGIASTGYRRGGSVLHDLAVQSSSRLIAVGAGDEHPIGQSGSRATGLVVAYRPDGSVDRSFGRKGRVVFSARRNRWEYTGLKAVEVLPDDRILVAGFRFGSLFLARLLPNGRPDRSFGGGDGKVSMYLGNRHTVCSKTCWLATPFAIDPAGRIVVLAADSPDWPVIVRLRDDGTLDRGFGRGGRIRVGPVDGHYLQPFDLALQGDRILLGGFDESGLGDAVLSFTVYRYSEDGRLDPSFAERGVDNRRAGPYSGAYAFLEQGDGRVVAAGGGQDKVAGEPYSSSYLLLTRYLPD